MARRPTANRTEWEYAARGPQSLIYPWGNEWNPDFPRHKRNSAFAISFQNQGKRKEIRNGETTVLGKSLEIGSRPRGKSWVNAHEMAGNVYEWCSSIYKPYPYQGIEAEEPLDLNTPMIVRGGSFDSHFTNLRCACRWSFDLWVTKADCSVRPLFLLQSQ
jgi:formylglycine-generating enzyme required for sulfatase activity